MGWFNLIHHIIPAPLKLKPFSAIFFFLFYKQSKGKGELD